MVLTYVDHHEPNRIDKLLEYLSTRSFVCLCQLLFRFHVPKDTALAILKNFVDAGRLRLLAEVSPEPVYVSTRPDLDHSELIEVTSDIEFAVGVLEDSFPGYQRGTALDEQGALGERIRKALHGSVALLSELSLVPDYWRSVRFNSTSIVLTLRHFLGDRSDVRSFLLIAEEFPDGVSELCRGMRQAFEERVERRAAIKTTLQSLKAVLVETSERLPAILQS
jgi:hypothetical protein